MSNKNYVITGCTEKYFQEWGISWYLSLKQFHDDIIIVDLGLSAATKLKLKDAILITAKNTRNFRRDIFLALSPFVKDNPGKYAYWDADAYFQAPIEELFEFNQLLISKNPGFFVVDSTNWSLLFDIQNLLISYNDDQFVLDYTQKYLDILFNVAEDKWNCVNIPALKDKDGKLTIGNITQNVIHFSGSIKQFLVGKNLTFAERNKNLVSDFAEKNLSRKLLIVNHKK